MKNSVRCFGLLVLLSLSGAANANAGPPDFVWEPGTVSAEVKFDKYRPEMSHYLYIKHTGSGAGNWNMAKLNLPESWKIDSVAVEGLIIRVTVQNAGEFTITPENLKRFRSELLKAKKPTDGQLEELWRTHALAEKKG